MTDLRQAAQQVLNAWDSPLWKTGTTAAAIADLRAALEQPSCIGKDPRCPCQDGDACHYKDCGDTKARPMPPTPPQQQAEPVAWMRPSEDGYDSAFRDHSTVVMCTGNPWTGWVPLYTTPPQRQWVGLTDEDVNRESAPIAQQMKLAFHAGMYVAQKILTEKNGG